MKVRVCMTKNVKVGWPSMSLNDAAELMKEGDFGSLPIGDNDRLVGMITDRDIVVRAVSERRDPLKTEVGEVMSKKILYCYDDEDVEAVAHNLGTNQVRRLPVLNRHKRLVGILSLGDIVQSDVEGAGTALRDITKDNRSSSFFETSNF